MNVMRHKTDTNGNEGTNEMEVSPEGEYSNVSPEMSNAQEEDHETDGNGIKLTQQPEVLLDGRKICRTRCNRR